MHNSKKINYRIDSFGLVSIGIVCLGYLLLGRSFAELHIQFSFFNFPVFIGEILLFLCLCLFLIKNKHQLVKINKRQALIITYFVFIVTKSLYGYSQFGPLALRHTALFCYPMFILFGYSFYRRDYFTVKKTIALSLAIIFIFITKVYDDYWTLACFIMAFCLIFSLQTKWLKYSFLTALVLVTPYKLLFSTSRMMMLANFIAIVYLIISFYLILKIKKRFKIAIFILAALFILGSAAMFMDRNAARSIISFKEIKEGFNSYDEEIQEELNRYEVTHSYGYQGVELYNPDEPGYFNLKSQKKVLGESETTSFQLTQRKAVKLYNPDDSPFLKKQESVGSNISMVNNSPKIMKTTRQERSFDGAVVNALFRIFIWRDMIVDLVREKPILGFNFGKPLRSTSLEVLHWGESEWKRDGWIGAHNSYLGMVYRAGIIGLLTIVAVFIILFGMIKKSVQCRSLIGVLLCGIIINWFIAANFLLILELPYTAIPIWTLFGLTYAYVGTLPQIIPVVSPEKSEEIL